MPRRGYVSKREVMADPVYGDALVARVIHAVMKQGKKRVAENVVYGSMDIIKDKTKEDPVVVLKKAVENAKPMVEVKSRRVGGATYQVPVEIRPERRLSLSIRWLVGYARDRGEKTMVAKLSAELIDAFNNRGTTIKKKEDTHKMAEANKAFAHYRW
ncbi:MAG: ribosomal protein S7 [Actinobacteria bacterium]|nr:ribosomal protein S7 [Actinomycetota bacterium]MBM2828164.1 ribosomal protein [Actinomycetota bacterium]